jgi:hypothetical protein
MTYFNFLQPHEKDFLYSLQKELEFTLQNEFKSDFDEIKSALKNKFALLKDSENITELGIILAQIKKAKEIQEYLQNIRNQILMERERFNSSVEKEFANW